MARAFIAVGSNVDREANVERALRRLSELVRIRAISNFYSTRPLEGRAQPDFLNGMVEVETDLGPLALKQAVLRPIEHELGRRRSADRHANRTIDLDLVLYGDVVSDTPELVLPDPQLEQRAFLAVPLMELAPSLEVPGTGRSATEIARAFDHADMAPRAEYSGRLRTRMVHGPEESRNARR